MTYDLDTLLLELNSQITANLARELKKHNCARSRLLVLEEWCSGKDLWYYDYFAVMPEQFKLDCAALVSHVSQLRVSVEYFAPYLLATLVDPLLKSESRGLYG